MENNIEVSKKIATAVVGYCVSAVVVTIIHQNTTTFTKTQKAKLYVGAFAIGVLVADRAKAQISKEIDEIVELYRSFTSMPDQDIIEE